MKLTAKFISLFFVKFTPLSANYQSFYSGYAAGGINYAKKFYEIDSDSQFHKSFFSIIYAAIGKLPKF